MNELTDQQLIHALSTFGIHPDSALVDAIGKYVGSLIQWNKKISLTSVEDPAEIVRLHFGESFFASTFISIRYGRLADVGSGAGFPGIPIKMLAPELDVSLIESNAKKAAFLSEIVRKLDLRPVQVLNIRAEHVPEIASGYDFVTARAVGDHRGLLKWAGRHLSSSGRVILFLSADAAINISKEAGWNWSLTQIPGSERRVILDGIRS